MCDHRTAYFVSKYNIPMELVVNFDQTGLHIVPTGGTRTFAVKGSKEVRLIGQDDKRQITGKILLLWLHIHNVNTRLHMLSIICKVFFAAGVPITAADGAMGPLQLVFTGKSPRCIADVAHLLQLPEFEHWQFTYSPNHWSSLGTMFQLIDDVLVPW